MVREVALSQAQYETIHEKNQEMPMRDGTILRGNITRPNSAGQFPVIIERTPVFARVLRTQGRYGIAYFRVGFFSRHVARPDL